MRLSRAYIIIGLLALPFLASCGKRYEAKNMVKDFVKTYAKEEIEITSFSDLDSTKVISDSLLQVLRSRAMSDPLFKKGFQFTAERTGTTLLFIRMKYGEDSLGMSKTFYFDKDLTGIVVFK